MIGTQILHYKIVEKLGEGGMGEVYRARDAKLDRDVALKFLPARVRSDPEARERLIREARAASQLHHTNIVSIFAIEEAEGRDFIVMEFVDGRPLTEIIRAGLTLEKAFELAKQIGEALAAAHEAGIVHRDMKSENILVTEKGQVKVLDFGLAKLKGTDKITDAGSTLGTMAYMSPEQTQGEEVDHRSDIFSFGVVLYEMITGHLPFTGDHSAAITYAIVHETPEPLARYKAGVSDDLQRIIDKVLRKDKRSRYQTVADMLADLGLASSSKMAAYAGRKRRRAAAPLAVVGAVVFVAVIAAAAFFIAQRTARAPVATPVGGRVMVAVLPFQNLGSPDDEYFADGITEEITTQLAKLSGLGVISRTSAMAYKKANKTLREIASELGVDYVLEGTIRWDRTGAVERVRINPQLIRVSDDTHLWADTYDRVLREIFALQSEIAGKVASALNVTLLESERAALGYEPTENLEAYQYFLRGREYYASQTSLRDRDLATQMFEKAIDIDPKFALAHAWLARIYANDYFNARNLDADPLGRAKAAADKALAYGGDLPEGHLAMGYYHYYGSRDYDRALEQFAIARKGNPNNTELLEAAGYVLRRQGRWDEAAESLRRAAELNPRSANVVVECAHTLALMRRFDDAAHVINRGLELTPSHWPLVLWKGIVTLLGEGNVDAARHAAQDAATYASADDIAPFLEVVDFLSRDFESCLRRRSSPPRAMDAMGADSSDFYVARAQMCFVAGKKELALSYADSALVMLADRLRQRPDDALLNSDLGVAYACLGRKAEAIRYGRRATELLPVSKDAVRGADLIDKLLTIYIIVGENDLAIDQLEYLLSIPSWLSVSLIRTSPVFDPIRDHPRVRRLIERYS